MVALQVPPPGVPQTTAEPASLRSRVLPPSTASHQQPGQASTTVTRMHPLGPHTRSTAPHGYTRPSGRKADSRQDQARYQSQESPAHQQTGQPPVPPGSLMAPSQTATAIPTSCGSVSSNPCPARSSAVRQESG